MGRGEDYDRPFEARQRAGKDVHGEARLMAWLGPESVLDAGCGTGRVAIELQRMGIPAVGVDVDSEMLATARHKAADMEWIRADLAVELPLADARGHPRRFGAVVLAGNVMIFLRPGTEAAVLSNLARHLQPGGPLVAGFQLQPGGWDLTAHDAAAAAAGLRLQHRWAGWDRQPWPGSGDYAVSVHRAPVGG